MDVSDIIDELDDHGFTDSTDARKLAVINSALWDACSRDPWPFLETSLTLTFAGSTTLPANAPADQRAVLWIQMAGRNTNRLRYIRYDDWLERFSTSTSDGGARYFYFIGETMHIWPAPAASDTATLYYINVPAELAIDDVEADIPLPVDFHREVLVNGALYHLYAMEDDTDIAPTFQAYFEQAIARLKERAHRRQYVDTDYVREPEDHYGTDPTDGGW